jgi:hypothetical protein
MTGAFLTMLLLRLLIHWHRLSTRIRELHQIGPKTPSVSRVRGSSVSWA